CKKPCAEKSMLLHDLILLRGKSSRLFEYYIRDRHFADVVKHRSKPEQIPVSVDLVWRNTHHIRPCFVESNRIGSNPAHMRTGLLRVTQFRHLVHPEDYAAGQFCPLDGVCRGIDQ